MADQLDIASAVLGTAVPVAYGYVNVVGNVYRQIELADKTKVVAIRLGKGEWDGIERLWINKKRVDHTNTSLVHFHPGIAGELGHGLAPDSTGGDNRVDTWFADFPAQLERVTDSGKATLWLKVPPDPAAPGPELTWVAHCRAKKCRAFDNAGNQTSYAFTTVPAWIALDLWIDAVIKPDAVPGAALTAAEKDRIDFPSWKAAADYHSAVLGSGAKRWEASVWAAERMPLGEILTQLMIISRSYMVEYAGKIYCHAHQTKASTFVVKAEHLAPNGFEHDKGERLKGAPNRFIANYRDLNPKKLVDITSISRASGVCTLVTSATHPLLVGDDVQVINPLNGAFAGAFIVASVPSGTQITYLQSGADASTTGGYIGTPESRFMEVTETLDHDQHALQIGPRTPAGTTKLRRVPITLNFGSCTKDQVQRALKFLAYGTLGPATAPYKAPWDAKLRCWAQSVDANSDAILEQLPGDKITIDKTVSEEFQGDYRIRERNLVRDTQQGLMVELHLHPWVDEAYSDASDTEQAIVPMPARPGLESVAGPANAAYRPTTNPLTARDNAGLPTVDVAGFPMRIFGVGDKNISLGAVDATSADFGKTAFIYYDDPGFRGGSVVFNLTFTREEARNKVGRFFVGSVALPTSGGAATVGNNDGGGGAEYTRDGRIYPASYTAANWSTPANGIDPDDASYASASTAGNDLTYEAYAFPQFNWFVSKKKLVVKSEITAVSGSTALLEYSLNGGASWTVLRSVSAADSAPVTSTVDLLVTQKSEDVRVRLRLPGANASGNASNYAGTAADDAGDGTRAWTNPTNAQGAPDATLATNTGQAQDTIESSHYLKATNFGFAVSGSATIVGILAKVKRRGSANSDPEFYQSVIDRRVRIVKGGVIQGTQDKADTGTLWPSVLTEATYGSASDLWGLAWTPTDINANDFGLAISVDKERGPTAGAVTASIDSVQITVYYTTAGASSATGRLYAVRQEISL